MNSRKENIRLLTSFIITGLLMAIILWLLSKFIILGQTNNQIPDSASINLSSNDNMSLGEEIFITKNNSQEKQEGSKAFANGDFATAVSKFTAALKNNRNDPEALIYLNNANAELNKSNTKPIKVAVIVLLTSVEQAEETLRGVAQAQDEINSSREKIKGAWLQLQIATITNIRDTQATEQINLNLVNDSSILAVVGFTPNLSIYNDRGLVLVSPVNPNSKQTSQAQKYIFYSTPSADVFSDKLAEYIVKTTGIRNIAICRDSSFQVRQDRPKETVNIETIIKLHQESIENKYRGQVTNTNCDLSDNSVVSNTLRQSQTDGAEGLLLFPSPWTINNANSKFFDLVRENKKQSDFPLFGFQTMYTNRILKYGKENVKKMVLAVAWHRDADPNNPFATKASQLWGGEVSPRTAVVYDALQAAIAGLQVDSTREGLQKALTQPNFFAFGAGGRIKFSSQGDRDREGGVFLVRVESCIPGITRGCDPNTLLHFQLVKN